MGFDHVEIHVVDLAASRRFYGEALGLPTVDGEVVEWGDFGILAVDAEHPPTRNLHVAFGAESRDDVDAWWRRLTEAGYESDGEPGERPCTARRTTARSSSTRTEPFCGLGMPGLDLAGGGLSELRQGVAR